MLKKIAALSIVLVGSTMSALPVRVSESNLLIPSRLGELAVSHDTSGFYVEKDEECTRIQPCFVDKEIRNVSPDILSKMLVSGSYLSVNKFDDTNEYAVRLNQRLNGGGTIGAWIGGTIGYYGVKGVGIGAWIGVTKAMDCVVPGSGEVALLWGSAAVLGAIESASITAAVGCSILGGVITGPTP